MIRGFRWKLPKNTLSNFCDHFQLLSCSGKTQGLGRFGEILSHRVRQRESSCSQGAPGVFWKGKTESAQNPCKVWQLLPHKHRGAVTPADSQPPHPEHLFCVLQKLFCRIFLQECGKHRGEATVAPSSALEGTAWAQSTWWKLSRATPRVFSGLWPHKSHNIFP